MELTRICECNFKYKFHSNSTLTKHVMYKISPDRLTILLIMFFIVLIYGFILYAVHGKILEK